MRRRRFLATAGALIGSGVFSFGTGAFTSVSAERTVSVSVADDDNAFLKLTQRGSGGRSYADGNPDTLGLEIPGSRDGDYGGTDPEGLGTNSVYRFGSDAKHDERGLFAAKNQGTQPIELYSTQVKNDGVPTVTMYDVDTGERLTEDSPSGSMDVGDQCLCGLEIDTHGVPVQEDEYDVTLTIHADATAD